MFPREKDMFSRGKGDDTPAKQHARARLRAVLGARRDNERPLG